jgi:hypothetical protein
MATWDKWFERIADHQVERGGLRDGKEISQRGIKEMPFGKDSITGYTIITAEDLDEAVRIAAECPFVDATRVYEIMGS